MDNNIFILTGFRLRYIYLYYTTTNSTKIINYLNLPFLLFFFLLPPLNIISHTLLIYTPLGPETGFGGTGKPEKRQ